METTSAVGQWLVQRLDTLGITQKQLARAAKMSESTLSDIIRGQTEFNARHAQKLANALDNEGTSVLGVSAQRLLEIAGLLSPTRSDPDVEVLSDAVTGLSADDRQQVLDYILFLKRKKRGTAR